MKQVLALSLFALLAACVSTDIPVAVQPASNVTVAAANPNLPGWPAPALPFDEGLATEAGTVASPVAP
jgi:hypothetical protein